MSRSSGDRLYRRNGGNGQTNGYDEHDGRTAMRSDLDSERESREEIQLY